jgi:membrane fusion protein, multidrug efflux system
MRNALLAALAGLALAACSSKESPPEVVRPVQLAQVSVGGVADLAVFAGEVKPRHEADLGFRIPGKIVERRVDVGAGVRRGQPLARLDPADVALQAQSAEAALAAAKTEDAYAKAELERYEDLFRQKFVSASALDQKRTAATAAASRLQQAQASLQVNRNQAGYATLVASDDGVITWLSAEVGQVVAAGQAVMKLARTDEREVAISVPENRLDDLKRAQRLDVIVVASPDKRYAAKVREISPSVDPITRTFAVRVSILDTDAALPWGTTANVVAVAAAQGASALVPLTSIYHQPDGKPAVWAYDPNSQVVSLRAVELGAYREDGVLVDGLANGQWIVAAGVNKLQPGQKVRPYEQPGKAAPAAPVASK